LKNAPDTGVSYMRRKQMGEFLIGFAVFGACLYALGGYIALVDAYLAED
jgi:hypothetical protein